MSDYRPMVNHLTEVKFTLMEIPNPLEQITKAASPTPDNVRKAGEQMAYRMNRIAEMMKLLIDKGFHFKSGKDAVIGYSNELEALETKRFLIANGFQDFEFQVFLEYERKWGIL